MRTLNLVLAGLAALACGFFVVFVDAEPFAKVLFGLPGAALLAAVIVALRGGSQAALAAAWMLWVGVLLFPFFTFLESYRKFGGRGEEYLPILLGSLIAIGLAGVAIGLLSGRRLAR